MKIGIITPVYHGRGYLKGLISMLETCTERLNEWSHGKEQIETEYILVNDSPDEPIREQDIESNGLAVRVSDNLVNSGIHQSRVNGLQISEADYILFLDQDDRIEADYLVKMCQGLINQHYPDVLVCNGYREYPDGTHKRLYATNYGLRLTSSARMYYYGTDMILSPGQTLIKRESIPDAWYEYILRDNGCDDCYLWLLMFEEKCRFGAITECLYYHREDVDNFSASSDNMSKSFFQMCNIMEENQLIGANKIHTLRRRMNLKMQIKSPVSVIKKLILTIKNIDIITMSIAYKASGYH